MRKARVMRLVKYKKSICLHKKQKTLVKALEYVHAFFFLGFILVLKFIFSTLYIYFSKHLTLDFLLYTLYY